MQSDASKHSNALFWTGIIATIGALIVGIGEFTFQYSPRGGYEDSGYLFFLGVSEWRLTFGHFLGVLVAPVYFIGYWHISQMLKPAGSKLSLAVLGLGIYAFAIGNVWLGGRVNLALVVQAKEKLSGDQAQILSTLLEGISAHNEPLINVVRVLVLVISLLMAWGIFSGKSHYPKWILAVLPIVLLVLIFASYSLLPSIGMYLLPAAMNIAHFIFFAASTVVASKMRAAR
ncbi:MAG: DUF6796 family protein [Hyphomicrobiales bacterium]